ncbi:MAG: UDP-2,3-diacylglucosamine diphosphatase [Candidatus Latescibacteria bacterium]|nr:UDP-2,3-diacylglucosamine diphosphatase [Candidatus Latescibacterota bacterium]
MLNDTVKNPDKIIFIADAHFGMPGDNPERIDIAVQFLRWLNGKISHLYIVGDLFDFWFEYKSVVPNTTPQVVFELYNLVRSGVRVTLFAGNHDYWLGPYLERSVGIHLVPNDLVVEHQGLKIYIHHGDGLYPHDHGYRIMKKVLRNRLSIFLFGLLHPDFAVKIARLTSKTSRNYIAPPDGNVERNSRLFRVIADQRLVEGYDAVVYGHSHVQLMEKRSQGTLILLGDWIKLNTYVLLENGHFTINNWDNKMEKENG